MTSVNEESQGHNQQVEVEVNGNHDLDSIRCADEEEEDDGVEEIKQIRLTGEEQISIYRVSHNVQG